ncbi:MAG: NAD-binding protein, partial [Bosea sp. (in: a-proteobacteria)]
ALSTRQVHVGASGAGHMAKIVNNLMCAAHLLVAGEAFKLAEAAGLDPERLLAAINGGSGRSGVTEVNFPNWVMNRAFDSGFTMQLMRKDVRLALQMAEETGMDLPLTQGIGALWAASAETIPDAEDFNRIADFRSAITG